jgi:hypothetical protein
MVYEVDGDEYIAIAAGGNQGVGSANGDAVWAFSLKGQLNPLWPPPPPPTVAGPTGPIVDGENTVKIGDNNVEYRYFPGRTRVKAGTAVTFSNAGDIPHTATSFDDADGERARDETVKAFADLYRRNPAEFPPEAREARYTELLRLSYPIHPELFDRLSKDWASLEKFQRTRGVLRFMANVVGVLWQAQVRDPLILPARVPVAHERVRASVLYPLDPLFSAVVDKEVDGDGSLPIRMEANPTRRISQARAARRAARAVFLCSAPLVGQPNAGLTGQGLRLACAEPGDQLAIFGEALRELSERATFLYEEAGRYWFSTQQTLNRLAEDLAKGLPAHEVDAAIVEVLREDGKAKGRFHRVFAVPDDPTAIDEAGALSLVILGSVTPHVGRSAGKSLATEAVIDTLMRCRAAQRSFRNTLLFVAADETQLATAREAMRRALAWESIGGDPRQDRRVDKRLQDQLTQAQLADAREKFKNNREGAARAVRTAWSHVLFPVESTEPGKPFDLDHLTLTARDRASVPAAVYEKASAKGDGIIKEALGSETLATRLAELWPTDRPHLPVAEIAEWFATYVYLPKLRDRVVLETAIRDALAKLDPKFAYAEGFDETSAKYIGPLWQKAPIGPMSEAALLVRPEVAMTQCAPLRRRRSRGRGQHRSTIALVPLRRSLRGRPRSSNLGGSTDRSRSTWFGR